LLKVSFLFKGKKKRKKRLNLKKRIGTGKIGKNREK